MLNYTNDLIFVRHGENEINPSKENNFLELTERGVEQAKLVHNILKNKFDIVICSTSLRAIETAKIIAPGFDLIQDEQLLERGWGNKKHDGLETDLEAYVRIENVIKKYCTLYPNNRILIVSHGSLMKLAENYLEEKDLNYKRNIIDNCDIIYYEKSNEKKYIKVKEII